MGFGKRIVVTGMGAVSCLGTDVDQFWSGLVEGRSGIGRIHAFDPTNYPVQIAGEVDVEDLTTLFPENLPPVRLGSVPNRTIQLSVATAGQALNQAGLDPSSWDPTRVGLFLGNGIGTMNFDDHAAAVLSAFPEDPETLSVPAFLNRAAEVYDPQTDTDFDADVALDVLAGAWNILGPCSLSMTACAASSQAIGEACFWIGEGKADCVIAGAAHSIVDPFGMTGFAHLTALSERNDDPTRASRPFDLDRDGFVLSEGAGILILESEEHARARGAEIFGEIEGYGISADAYRVTDPEPEGVSCVRALRMALDRAELSPDKIGAVNAHGTSTYANDRMETKAVKTLLGERAYSTPIHSIKSMVGHAIAATGALEAIAALQTLREGVVPPTINQETPDPECDLDTVPNVAREIRVDHILSNSFGFGGQNVALVLGRYS